MAKLVGSAWVLALFVGSAALVGCGDDGETVEDGAGGETAEGGGGEGGSGPLMTTVEVRGERSGMPGIALDVIVNDASGKLVAHVPSGVDGNVEVELVPGGSVSLAHAVEDGDRIEYQLITYVLPEDTVPEHVVMLFDEPRPSVSQGMSIEATFATESGAADYRASLTCGSGSSMTTTIAIPEYDDCTGTQMYDLAVSAYAADGTLLGYDFAVDQPVQPGELASHGFLFLDKPLANVSLTAENIPTNAVELAAETVSARGNARVTSGHLFGDLDSTFSTSLVHATDFGKQHCQGLTLTTFADGTTLEKSRYSRCSEEADTTDVVWNASRLARYRFEMWDDALPLELRWTETWPGELGDFFYAGQAWKYEEDLSSENVWSVYMPPGTKTSIAYPELPASLEADFLLREGAILFDGQVDHWDDAAREGYADFLATGTWLQDSYESTGSAIWGL